MANFNEKKPSDRRLTRRRIMEVAIATGMTPLAASQLTVEDVKAADSDQTPIPLDVEGKSITYVPSDWYDHLQTAKDVQNEMEERFFNKDSVNAISINAGSVSGENPHVKIKLNENSSAKEERRGEIPEEKDGVKIETSEVDPGVTALCSDPEYNSDEDMPGGGVRVYPVQDDGTAGPRAGCLSPQMIRSSSGVTYGWGISMHLTESCPDEMESPVFLTHKVDGENAKTSFAKAIIWDPQLDFVFFKEKGIANPSPNACLRDSINQDCQQIDGTLTLDGLSTIASRSDELFKMRGVPTCQSTGDVGDVNESKWVSGGPFCANQLQSQFWYEGEAEQGDSGSVVYTEEKYDGGYRYAAGPICGTPLYTSDNFCTGGHKIRDYLSVWYGN